MAIVKPTRNKSYGPYEVITETKPEGRVLVAIKFTEVVGCNVLIGVSDNIASVADNNEAVAVAEVTIWGVVQGYANMLKRSQLTMQSGPMRYCFPYEEAYDEIRVRAYNHSQVAALGADDEPLSMKVSIFIQPRGGFSL